MAIKNTNTSPLLKEGANITLTQSGQVITIAANDTTNAPGGSDTQVQFNDGGNFGGDAGLTYNKTTNVLGVESIDFAQTPAAATAERRLKWDQDEGSLVLTLKGGNVTIPLGHEVVTLVYNAEANTLTKGTVVYAFGAQGQRISVKRAVNTGDATSAQTIGIVAESIASGAEGWVMVQGMVRGLDTSAYVQGDALYLGATAGTFTKTKPYAPNHLVYVGIVVKVNASSGEIFSRCQNGYELDELHNVSAQSPSNNDGIFWNSSTNLWEKKSISTALGYTPAPASRMITINGTSQDLTADRTWSVGTVTSVGLSAPTGFSVSNSPVISSGTLALSFASGYSLPTTASQTNWDTAYTNRLTSLTTTGSSGAATLISNTLNIPNYTLAGLGGVPTGRTITINGTAQDLSTDRTYSVGTVTSIATSAPITGGTITGSGTIGITQASGSSNGYLSSTDWTTFNNKQNALTNPITGTGTSGQVTYFNGTTSITSESALFWDSTNDRLGIGTPSPEGNLHVAGSIRVGETGSTAKQTIIYHETTGNGYTSIQSVYQNVAYTPIVLNASGGNVGIGTASPAAKLDVIATAGNSGYSLAGYPFLRWSTGDILEFGSLGTGLTTWQQLRFLTNNTERIVITSGGNVGIGTASPVGGGAANDRTLSINAATGAATFVTGLINNTRYSTLFTAADIVVLETNAAIPLAFNTNNAEAMRIDSSGRLLIGTTTSSTYKLDVNGTGRFSGQLDGINAVFKNSSVPALQLFRDVDVTSVGPAAQILEFGARNGASFVTGAAISGVLNNPATTGTLIFQTLTGGSLTTKATLDSSGNLGLGVTPTVKFQVETPSSGNGVIFRYTGGTNNPGLFIQTEESSKNVKLIASGSVVGGQLLQLGAEGSTCLNVGANNVGLGVTPSAWASGYKALQVGNSSLASSVSMEASMFANAYGVVGGYNYISSAKASYYSQYDGGHSWATAPSGTAGNAITFTQAMTLDASGRLGIGTNSPSYKLDVTGEIRALKNTTYATEDGPLLAASATTPAKKISIGYDNTNDFGYISALYSGVTWKNLILQGQSGNVGINTTSPVSALDVNGTLSLAGYNFAVKTGNYNAIYTAQGNIGIYLGNSTDPGNYYDNAAHYFRSVGAGTYYMSINTTGVGIGTQSPVSKLTVEGGAANWNETIPGTSNGTIHLDPGSSSSGIGNAITFGAHDSSSGTTAQAGIYVRSDGSFGTKMYFATTDAYITGSKTRMTIQQNGQLKLNNYTTTTSFSGTPVGYLAFENDGDIITRSPANVLSDIGALPTTGATISPVSAFEIDNTSTAINLRVVSSASVNLYAKSSNNSDTNPVLTVQKVIDQPGAPTSVGATSSINFTVTNSSGVQTSPGYISAEHTSFSPANGDLKLYSLSSGSNISTLNCSSGIVKLPQGQIEFPATQNASSNSNTLDDYEEGNWTPAFGNTGASITYATDGQVGAYTKIGRQVTCTFRLQLSTSTMTGNNLTITGLPFTSANVTNREYNCPISWQSTISTFVNVQGRIAPSSSTLNIYKTTAASTLSTTSMIGTDIGTNSIIFGVITYFV